MPYLPNKLKQIIFLATIFFFFFLAFEISAASCELTDWNKEDCELTINYSDPGDGSGLSKCLYTIVSEASPSCPTDGTWSDASNCDPPCSDVLSCNCSTTVPIGSGKTCATQGEGTCRICSKAIDLAGNIGTTTAALDIDYTPPQTTIKCDNADCTNVWYTEDVSITLSCTDNLSGCTVYYCQYQTTECTPVSSGASSASFTITNEGTTTVRYYSIDGAGNQESDQSKSVKLDKSPPNITNISPTSVLINEEKYYSASTSDAYSGVDLCYFYQDGTSKETIDTDPSQYGAAGCDVTTANKYSFSTYGAHNVGFLCYDLAGKSQYTTREITVGEENPPTTEIKCNDTTCLVVWYDATTSTITVTLDCDEPAEESGCTSTQYCVGTPVTPCTTFIDYVSGSPPEITDDGVWDVKYYSIDLAGNQEETRTKTIKLDTTPPIIEIKE